MFTVDSRASLSSLPRALININPDLGLLQTAPPAPHPLTSSWVHGSLWAHSSWVHVSLPPSPLFLGPCLSAPLPTPPGSMSLCPPPHSSWVHVSLPPPPPPGRVSRRRLEGQPAAPTSAARSAPGRPSLSASPGAPPPPSRLAASPRPPPATPTPGRPHPPPGPPPVLPGPPGRPGGRLGAAGGLKTAGFVFRDKLSFLQKVRPILPGLVNISRLVALRTCPFPQCQSLPLRVLWCVWMCFSYRWR